MMDLGGVVVPIIDLADLLRNKSSTGRKLDEVDVERLAKRRGET